MILPSQTTADEIYSSKLVQALRHIRSTSPASTSEQLKRGRAVHEAADRALAMTAKGRSRWSRAIILRRRLKLKKGKRSSSVTTMTGKKKKKKQRVLISGVKLKAKVLGRLVPGCRKQSMAVILEETGDYIAALQMQVRVMTQLLSG